jgi:methionine sulfoxide reductase heme-binding subunit
LAAVKTYWYLTRSTGAVALILLTVAIVIGIALVGRVRSERWPRFAVDGLHRSVSLLAIVFLAVHVVTAVLDSFAPISLLDAVIPFVGVYRPVWLGLGAAAFDLLLAVAITSVLRQRIGHRAWRAVHWLAYPVWPLAIVHGLGTGSDVHQGWMTVIYVACAVAFATAVLTRVVIGWPERARLRLAAVGTLVAFAAGMAVWLPGGPFGANWARRAGTPPSLLPHTVSRPSPS